MSYVLNMVGGGGGFSAYDAILRVVAPSGSTVIVTKGSVNKTLPAFAMSGTQATNSYYYVVKPSAFDSSPWTVSATSGGETSTSTVVINSAGEYIMQLSFFDGILYSAGDEAVDQTGGFETFFPAFVISGAQPSGCTKGSTTMSIAFTSGADNWYNGAFGTVNKVNLAGFTTLHVTTTSASHSGTTSNFAAFGVQGSDSAVTAKHTQVDSPKGNLAPTASEPCSMLSVGDNELDVSALSEGFVWFGGASRGSGSCNIVVTKIWLS